MQHSIFLYRCQWHVAKKKHSTHCCLWIPTMVTRTRPLLRYTHVAYFDEIQSTHNFYLLEFITIFSKGLLMVLICNDCIPRNYRCTFKLKIKILISLIMMHRLLIYFRIFIFVVTGNELWQHRNGPGNFISYIMNIYIKINSTAFSEHCNAWTCSVQNLLDMIKVVRSLKFTF